MKISLNRREFLRLGALTAATGVGLDLSGLAGMAELSRRLPGSLRPRTDSGRL